MIARTAFGNTGHESSRVIFGGAALGKVSQDEADRTLELLQSHGVNHLDLAASYGNGEAEKRVGPWMGRHRGDFFLATKTGKRTYKEAWDEFRSSLDRLRTDRVDLLQMHNLTDPAEWETAMGPGGALEALLEAQGQGLARHIGVTGHGMGAPSMHMRSIGRHAGFASVLLPYNFIVAESPDYARDFRALVGTCRQKGIAVQTIKSLARRPYPGERTRNCWYEPLERQEDVDRAVAWVLGDPEVFLISLGDTGVLPRVLQAAEKPLSRPSDEAMRGMVEAREMRPIFDGPKALSKA